MKKLEKKNIEHIRFNLRTRSSNVFNILRGKKKLENFNQKEISDLLFFKYKII